MILKKGSQGENVKKIQAELKRIGYYKLYIDGIFGIGTEQAVKIFQQKMKITADGIVGKNTWDRLFPKKEEITTNTKKSVLEGSWKITSPFGERIHPITKKRSMHNGVDLAGVPKGNAVYCPIEGKVTISNLSSSAGNWIHVQNGAITCVFMHLDKREVKVGESIKKCQKIGSIGTTGNSMGVHLHFEVRKNGVAINPKDYIYFT